MFVTLKMIQNKIKHATKVPSFAWCVQVKHHHCTHNVMGIYVWSLSHCHKTLWLDWRHYTYNHEQISVYCTKCTIYKAELNVPANYLIQNKKKITELNTPAENWTLRVQKYIPFEVINMQVYILSNLFLHRVMWISARGPLNVITVLYMRSGKVHDFVNLLMDSDSLGHGGWGPLFTL